MKLNLFLLCLTGVSWMKLQAARFDYFLITTPDTWENAQLYCLANYEDLARMETSDDWNRLISEAQRKGLPVTGWIGLQLIESWRWAFYDQTTADTMPIDNWVPGQPDNLGGHQECVAEDASGSWLDYDCTDLKPFICWDDTQGFLAITNLLTWEQGRDYCTMNHRDLAFPVTAEQSSTIHNLVLITGTSWIGIHRYGWTWTNDADAIDIPWRPGYPNNAELSNTCGSVNNSLVEDKLCNNTYNYFCHKRYTVKKQVMRLKFHGDNHLFEAATQTYILQKIEQKLKDLGITKETTVSWKVYSDGHIFQKL